MTLRPPSAFVCGALPPFFPVVVFLAADALCGGLEAVADALLRLGGFGVLLLGLGVGVVLAAHELDLRDLGTVAAAVAEPQDTRVAAGPLRESRRERVEQLGDDGDVLHVARDETAGVQRLRGLAGGDASLGEGDQTLDERAQLLGLRQRRLDALVAQQRGGLIAKERQSDVR